MGQGRPCGACRWQCAVYRLKRRSRLRVNPFIVQIDPRLQIDLRSGNVQKRPGIVFRQFRGFAGTDHIVGNRGDGGNPLDRRQQAVERQQLSHISPHFRYIVYPLPAPGKVSSSFCRVRFQCAILTIRL